MRIVWTKDEKRAMRDCMIDICYVNAIYSNKALLQKAQEEVIPYERRVKITDQRVFNYKALINEAREAAEKHRRSVAKNPPRPRPQPAAPEPAPRKLDTLGEVFELLVDAVADRIVAKLEARSQAKPAAAEEPVEE